MTPLIDPSRGDVEDDAYEDDNCQSQQLGQIGLQPALYRPCDGDDEGPYAIGANIALAK